MVDEESPSVRLNLRNRALSDEAIDWIVRLESGDPGGQDRVAFEDWRNRSPAHAAAADEAAALLRGVGQGAAAQDYRMIGDALRMAPNDRRARIGRRAFLGGGLAAAVAGSMIGSGFFGPASRMLADYGTGVGERRRVRLADGSTAWLNTASALSVDFSGRDRRLTLHAGEALFDVAHDRTRPFIVQAGEGEARALGTVYSVRRRDGVSDVAVSTGAVEVRNGSDAARVQAGQRLSFGQGIIGAIHAADPAAMTAWVRGKMIFNRRSVAEVMAEMERYHHGRIVVLGDRLRDLRISGVFPLDDPDRLFRSVAAMAGAQIVQMPLLTILR